MPLIRVGDLQIDEDIEWERGEWKFERIGWGLMALMIAAALLGFLGSGPMSNRIAGEEGGSFWVEHNRFIRYNNPEQLFVFIGPQFVQEDEVRLVIEGDFSHENMVRDITPNPDSVELSTGRLVYVWKVTDADGPMQINFQFRANQLFQQNSQFGPEQGELVHVPQFVFP
jgi:hypothetical protein